MDTKKLVEDAKVRFGYNTAKNYLKEKYQAKLIIAEQGGLWKATPELIGYLACSTDDQVILIDTFENPVLVDRVNLHMVLQKTYNDAMALWYKEYKELEVKR